MGDTFTIISTTGSVTGSFANAATSITVSGVTYAVAYTGGVGVVLTVTGVSVAASPSPTIPPGGIIDNFGQSNTTPRLGSTAIDGSDIDNGSLNVWRQTAEPGATHPVARNFSFQFGTNEVQASLSPLNSAMPGFFLAWTYPNGLEEKWWLPIDGSGILPNGIIWAVSMQNSYGIPYINLDYQLPESLVSSLDAGTHKISYWLQDTDGNRSNKRWEIFTIEELAQNTTASRELSSGDLVFKLMLSKFNNGTLNKFDSGEISVVVGDAVINSALVSDGLAEVSLPKNTAASIVFNLPGYSITWRAEFEGGYLNLVDESFNGTAIKYYEDGEGAYAVEYYRHSLYICSTGDIYGPIMGILRIR